MECSEDHILHFLEFLDFVHWDEGDLHCFDQVLQEADIDIEPFAASLHQDLQGSFRLQLQIFRNKEEVRGPDEVKQLLLVSLVNQLLEDPVFLEEVEDWQVDFLEPEVSLEDFLGQILSSY